MSSNGRQALALFRRFRSIVADNARTASRSMSLVLSQLKWGWPLSHVLRGARLFLVLVYSVVFLEFFARLFAPSVIMPRYVVDAPYGIRMNMPNRSIWHHTPDYRINIRTNTRGVRADTDIPYEKAPDVFRVVALGGSFTLGYGVVIEDLFLTQMAAELGAAGVKCEIVNLAVSGHSTAEELITLQEEGLRYQPDLVLVGWHPTDLDDNVRTDLFRLEDGQLVRANETYLPAVAVRKFLFSFRLYAFIAEKSHLYNATRETVSEWVIDGLTAYRLWRRCVWNLLYSSETGEGSASRTAEYKQALATALLVEVRDVAEAQGADLMVLDIPRVRTREGRRELVSFLPLPVRTDFDVYSPVAELNQMPIANVFWQRSAGHWTPRACASVGQGLASHMLVQGRFVDR